MSSYHWIFRTLLLLVLLLSAPVMAANRYFTFTFEDDLFVGRDYGYTGGVQLAWADGPAQRYEDIAPHWVVTLAQPLWLVRRPAQERAVSYKLGMAVFTPMDLEATIPRQDDMPYSGMVYGQITLHAFDGNVADRAYALVGLVGPASGIGNLQKEFHRLIGSQVPQGWDTQLDNEPVFKLGAARKWRTHAWDFTDSPWGMDLITYTELGAGTLDSNADLGLSWRIGKSLLRSFPTSGVLPGRDVNPLAGDANVDMNFFIAVLARFQPNAVYIEGNNFGGKRSGITLNKEQYYLATGAAWNVGDWGFLFSVAHSNKLFEESRGTQTFGSLSTTYRY